MNARRLRFDFVSKLSQRLAALAPRITIGLILFAVALTSLLAYRAFEASRGQRQVAEQTLREYAGFAAFQLKGAAMARAANRHRLFVDRAIRWINTRGPTPPLGALRLAELSEAPGSRCRCADSVEFHYQITFADSAIEATASALATEINTRRVRDTVIAHAAISVRRIPPGNLPLQGPGGFPVLAPQLFSLVVVRLDGRPYVLAQALILDAFYKPLVAYGVVVTPQQFVGAAVRDVLAAQPVLPRSLTRGLAIDSLLAVRVVSSADDVLFETRPNADRRYAATDTLERRAGGLRFEVMINPSAAERLIIGGLPQSRLPEILATTFIAVSLLGLLWYQFRRQEELGRLRHEFVSGVSHELRTPLAQIRLLAELLRLGKVPTEERRERSLRIIDQEARRLSFLVDSILSFTNASRRTLAPVETDVTAEIEEIISGFEPLAHTNAVQLATRLEPGLMAMVDPGVLRQVLLNLLDNAVRYGPPRQTITVATTSAPTTWSLAVEDQGPGIPTEERDRIFAPYYRMSRDAGGAVGGTGIGLAVVRRLVDDHGGRVSATSVNDAHPTGARFVVDFPKDPPHVGAR